MGTAILVLSSSYRKLDLSDKVLLGAVALFEEAELELVVGAASIVVALPSTAREKKMGERRVEYACTM